MVSSHELAINKPCEFFFYCIAYNYLLFTKVSSQYLKWYYDENLIFPIEAILKHKQVIGMRRKMPFTFFQISLFVPEIFKFLKYAN